MPFLPALARESAHQSLAPSCWKTIPGLSGQSLSPSLLFLCPPQTLSILVSQSWHIYPPRPTPTVLKTPSHPLGFMRSEWHSLQEAFLDPSSHSHPQPLLGCGSSPSVPLPTVPHAYPLPPCLESRPEFLCAHPSADLELPGTGSAPVRIEMSCRS